MTKVEIGLATLYHVDAREVALAPGFADMIFTDPPYGHNNNDGDLISNWERALGVLARMTCLARSRMMARKQTSLCAGYSRTLNNS